MTLGIQRNKLAIFLINYMQHSIQNQAIFFHVNLFFFFFIMWLVILLIKLFCLFCFIQYFVSKNLHNYHCIQQMQNHQFQILIKILSIEKVMCQSLNKMSKSRKNLNLERNLDLKNHNLLEVVVNLTQIQIQILIPIVLELGHQRLLNHQTTVHEKKEQIFAEKNHKNQQVQRETEGFPLKRAVKVEIKEYLIKEIMI